MEVESTFSPWKGGVLTIIRYLHIGEKSEIRTRTNSATNCRATFTLITPYWLRSRESNPSRKVYETSEAIVPLRNIGFRDRNRTDIDKIMSLTWETNTLPEWSK